MTYETWRAAHLARVGGDSRHRARVWNLDHEERVAEVSEFKHAIATRWAEAGSPDDGSIEAILDASIGETRAVASKWLGLMAVAAGATRRIPRRTYTHVSGEQAARYGSRAPIDPRRPFATVELPRFKWRESRGGLELESRFIWVTWPIPGRRLPRDPTVVKRELGLAHFDAGDCVYRIRVEVDASADTCFVPTCLDAGLYEAWAPPPAGHTDPWGLTRDLSSGDPTWPELLIEAATRRTAVPKGYLVRSSRGAPAAIGAVAVDFMVGRRMTP